MGYNVDLKATRPRQLVAEPKKKSPYLTPLGASTSPQPFKMTYAILAYFVIGIATFVFITYLAHENGWEANKSTEALGMIVTLFVWPVVWLSFVWAFIRGCFQLPDKPEGSQLIVVENLPPGMFLEPFVINNITGMVEKVAVAHTVNNWNPNWSFGRNPLTNEFYLLTEWIDTNDGFCENPKFCKIYYGNEIAI